MFSVCVFAERVKRREYFSASAFAFDFVEATGCLFLVALPNTSIILVNFISDKVDTLRNRVNTFVLFHLKPYALDLFVNDTAQFPKRRFVGAERPLIVAITIIESETVFVLNVVVEPYR